MDVLMTSAHFAQMRCEFVALSRQYRTCCRQSRRVTKRNIVCETYQANVPFCRDGTVLGLKPNVSP